MNCKNCGANLNDNARFCGSCGAVVEKPEQKNYTYCNYCGAKIEAGAAFCGACGRAAVSNPPNDSSSVYRRNNRNSGQDNGSVLLMIIIMLIVVILAGGAIWLMVSRYLSHKDITINPIELPNTSVSNNIHPAPVSGTVNNPTMPPTLPPTQTPPAQDTSTGDYLFNSDTQYITEAFLNTQSQSQVRLILNEMYARHGYIFSSQQYIDYFSSKSWYTPIYTSDAEAESYFNAFEKENKNIIIKYEKSKGWR